MKEAIKHIASVLTGMLLIPVAIIVIARLVIPALIWKIYVSIFHDEREARDILTGTASFFISIASSLDKFGNCAFGGFFNAALTVNSVHPFGENTETVSIALGWAYKHNDLNKTGLMLRSFVNWIDFTVSDHCEYSRLISIRKARKIMNEHNSFTNLKIAS